MVPLDDRLKATIEEMARLRHLDVNSDPPDEASAEEGQGRPRPQSSLTPREMQARLRAGSTLAAVAREAGVDEAWVEPFAVPILAERAEVVARAQLMTLSKARLGASAQPLGTSVRWNLAGRGLSLPEEQFRAAWTAWNLANGTWVVRFGFVSRRRAQVAEWEVDLRAGSVSARNRLATELGYADRAASRRVRPPSELEEVRAASDGAVGGRPARTPRAAPALPAVRAAPAPGARRPARAAAKKTATKKAAKNAAAKRAARPGVVEA